MERKQSFLDQKIEVLRRAKKWTFFKGVSPWILSKNRNFFYRCFSVKLWQKTSFFDIYERKQLFLDQKIEVLTRAKKGTFFKGVSPWIFFPKIELFLMGVFHRNHIRKHRFGYCGKKRMILRGKN